MNFLKLILRTTNGGAGLLLLSLTAVIAYTGTEGLWNVFLVWLVASVVYYACTLGVEFMLDKKRKDDAHL